MTGPPLAVRSEYGQLEQVVMASPRHFRVVEPINSAQARHFASDPPITARLLEEQGRFVEVLTHAGVEVTWAEEQPESPFQLNTRDVGAVVGDEFIVGRMRRVIRQREPDAVVDLLTRLDAKLVSLPGGTFEGGDVLVDGDTVYVGLSQRTNEEAVLHLRRHLEERGVSVLPVRLDLGVLHLDVALNLVAPGIALAYPPAFPDGLPKSLLDTVDVIEITDSEDERLGTNVFAIRPGLVVIDVRNPRIAELLSERGLEVVTIDYQETTKIGGSFRCMTLPLRRRA